jgi:acyl-coenzyme A synthetase/AMP-(fatty) acid ligase
MLPDVAYFPTCYYGALRAGAAVVPMSVLLKEREVAFHLRDSDAKVLLAWRESADAARAGAEQTGAECAIVEPGEFEALLAPYPPAGEAAERRSDDTAVLLYTSGTTGHAEGRRAHARQPPAQRGDHRAPLRARRVLGNAGHAAVLPRIRPDVRAQTHRSARVGA